jgi:hypothetical protein
MSSLDLTAATRVHLVEPGWNPMLEKQALDRVHRLGQTQQVKQIRYVVEGADSIECVSAISCQNFIPISLHTTPHSYGIV